MSTIGIVESLWRYPVKSMCGEQLDELFASYAGVYGDRLFAFESSAGRKGFPFFTGREQRQMIRYRPHFRNPNKAAQDRKSTRLNSSHQIISYAVFCLKKKNLPAGPRCQRRAAFVARLAASELRPAPGPA